LYSVLYTHRPPSPTFRFLRRRRSVSDVVCSDFCMSVLYRQGRPVTEWISRKSSRKSKIYLTFSLNELPVIWICVIFPSVNVFQSARFRSKRGEEEAWMCLKRSQFWNERPQILFVFIYTDIQHWEIYTGNLVKSFLFLVILFDII